MRESANASQCQGGPSPWGICDPASAASLRQTQNVLKAPMSTFCHRVPGAGEKLILLFILLLWAALPGMPGSLGGCRDQDSRTGQREGCGGCSVSNVTPPQANASPVSSFLIMRALVLHNLPLNKLENKLLTFFSKANIARGTK